ncbi:MAG: 50S ribosomal protein L21 [Verrucomicrobiota bacterium]
MEAYAVVETGGKQYRVQKGNVLEIELLEAETGKSVKLPRVLAVSDGKDLTVGTPDVSGAAVTAKVLATLRGRKVISFKKKRRKGYHKKIGHRQELMKIEIEKIAAK